MTQTMLPPSAQAQAQPVYEISDEDKKRIQRIQDAWKAYNGELDPPLQKMPDGTDPNVLDNRCGPVVDAGVTFLFGQELEISCEEDAVQEAQDTINDTWGRKEQRIPLLQDLAYNGAVAGSGFLRIVPDNKGNFRLVTVDPSIVVGMQTAPQDCDTVLLFCIQYSQMEKGPTGRPREVFYREEITRIDPDGNASKDMPDDDDTWQIQHWTQVGVTGMQPKLTGWTAAGPPITWPYPFPPLFHCKNLPNPNNAWGKPDITPDLIGMNTALNMVQSCIAIIEILYGQPFIVGEAIGESNVNRTPGVVMLIPPGGKVYSVTLTSDVANALVFAKNLRSDMDELSMVPSVATGRIENMPRGNLSGVAIELLFMSLLKKTEGKRCRYGELIIDVSKALLVLNHLSGDIDIELAWQNPLPHDDLAALQASVTKLEIGVSKTTVLREAGYDPDEEQALNDEEDAQTGAPPA
jgi:Phage portal protein, SPP1 Gp6-like